MGIVNHLGGEFPFYSNVKGEKKAEGRESVGTLMVDFSLFFDQIFRTRKYLNVVENGKNGIIAFVNHHLSRLSELNISF